MYMLIPSQVCTKFQRHPNPPRCTCTLHIPHNPPLKSPQGRKRSPENSPERYPPLASIPPNFAATNTSQRANVPVPPLPLHTHPPPNHLLPRRPLQKSQRRQNRSPERNRRIPQEKRRRIQRIRKAGAYQCSLPLSSTTITYQHISERERT